MRLRLGAAACLALAASCSDAHGSSPGPLRLEIRVARIPGAGHAPVALTASDGTGLVLRELQAKVVIEPPLAFTQIELAFQNPEPRRIEGRLELALPERASISRLALQIGGTFQEGELVERPRATVAYEEALHQRRDPALLERDAGNQYRMRVFPIEAHETKRVIVAYSEIIGGDGTVYRLPLSGLPKIDHVRAEISHAPGQSGAARRVFDRRRWQPDGDLLASLPGSAGNHAVVSGTLALLQVTPATQSRAAPIERLTLLFDTSASAAAGFEQRIARLRALLTALQAQRGSPIPLQLVVFDQEFVPLLELRSDQLGPELEAQLRARGALGATDFSAALRGLANLRELGDRVIAYTDGIATAGESGGAALAERVAELQTRGVRRFDVVTYGSIADRPVLETLVHADLPEAGVIVTDDDPDAAAARLLQGTEPLVEIEIDGAEWTYPRALIGVEPGRAYPIFAKLRDPRSLALLVGVERVRLLPIAAHSGGLLEREWARARIEYLEHERTERSEADAVYARERIVELSLRHRVLSEATAWVVLETEADYARHRIERSTAPLLAVRNGALVAAGGPQPVAGSAADEPWLGEEQETPEPIEEGAQGARNSARESGIIGVRAPPDGIATIGRGALANDPTSALGALMATQVDSAFGIGGLGVIGTGRALGGHARADRHEAAGAYRARTVSVPVVRAGKSDVRGALSKEVVRRIIQRHINEVRFCYEQGLVGAPGLVGRVAVKFIIAPTGSVQNAALSSSTLGKARIEQCIVNAVRRWTFPSPEGGGVVVVTYPFLFDPLSEGGISQRAERRALARGERQAWERQTFERRAQAQKAQERRLREREWRARPRPTAADALSGPLLEVAELLEAGEHAAALARARVVQRQDPLDVIALLALARAARASDDRTLAARAYGSLIDLYPSRAELRRAAGQGLEELGADALALAIDSYRKAAALRPDHPSGQRLLGLALWRAGERSAARAELERGRDRGNPLRRFPGITGILDEDAGLAAGGLPARPMVRICVYWENDATDVDLLVFDGMRRAAGAKRQVRMDGPSLSADITTGFGPECLTANGSAIAFPYLLQVRYTARGAMGHALGAVHVMQVDRRGQASFEMRPFVLMKDAAFAELGSVRAARP